MAKQRKLEDQPFGERLKRSFNRWPPDHLLNGEPDAITLGRWEDESGQVWLKRRSLTTSGARKMLTTAEVMVIGDPDQHRSVNGSERQVVWDSIEKLGCLPEEEPSDYLTYEPYEFDSEDGRTMLFVQRQC